MKKLLIVSAANSIHTVKWVNTLSKYYEVHLAYCSNHSPKLHKVDDKVVLHELKFKAPIGYYFNVLSLRKINTEVKPDFINVHYASGYGTLARVAKLPNIVLNVWGSDVYDFPNESRVKRLILRKNIFYAKKLASTSNIMAKEVYKQFPNLAKKIYITPFGVDVNKFRSARQKKNNNKFIIGNIKTLSSKYGIKYLILGIEDFIKNLKRDKLYKNNILVYIYGDGDQKEELVELIKQKRLENVVFLKGKISNDEVPNALNMMDVFCATSILSSESFGVAVVEAMACEVPVIATKIDGFSEVMVDKETGILIEKENFKEISTAIRYMYDNKNERITFGHNARNRVLENYNWDNNVKTMMEVLEKK